MSYTFKQIMAIDTSNKKRLKNAFENLNEQSGIYFLTREEDGFKYAYIGQAKHILSRLAEHMRPTAHLYIDNSLRKHKLWNEDNKTGWFVQFINCDESQLNEYERFYINIYANMGYQMLNRTAGGQDKGKVGIGEQKANKGYYDGVAYGESKTIKKIKELFDKYLDATIKGGTTKTKERKLKEFWELINGIENN